jgi:hypothetical protein
VRTSREKKLHGVVVAAFSRQPERGQFVPIVISDIVAHCGGMYVCACIE